MNLGPFPFAQAVRKHIRGRFALDASVWVVGDTDASLSICFEPSESDIHRALGVIVKARYWVGRAANGSPRVSFEFNPKSAAYPALCDSLASDFRRFLDNRVVPDYCVFSQGATVLRVPMSEPAGKEQLDNAIQRAVGLFAVIHSNLPEWREARLPLLLPGAHKSRPRHPPEKLDAATPSEDVVRGTDTDHSDNAQDALDDLEAYKSSYEHLTATEREDVRKSRIGQGSFRLKVMAYWSTCALTGIAEQSILRASHIKPWRVANNRERLDPFNGLLLAPNLDALFDAGLMSFDDSGRVLLSGRLSDADRRLMALRDDLRLRKMDAQHRKYLRDHRQRHGFES
jgi:hypothetical protein